MSTLSTINRLGAIVDEPPVALDYVEQCVQMPDLKAYTAKERQWQKEAELESLAELARCSP